MKRRPTSQEGGSNHGITPGSDQPALNPNCPLCGRESEHWVNARDQFYEVAPYEGIYWNCTACSHRFMFPIPDQSQIGTFYPTGYWQEQERGSFLARMEAFYSQTLMKWDVFRWVKRSFLHWDRRGRYLDVGCSRGDLPAMIMECGFWVEAIESDPRAADYAQRRYGLLVHQVDVGEWPIEGIFDVISAFHVLEHLRDPKEFLGRISSSLGPKGRFVLRVPNVESLQAKIMGRKWKGLEFPRHLSHFSQNSLLKLLNSENFRVVSLSTWSLRDGPPALASSLFRRGEPTWQAIQGKPNAIFKMGYLLMNWVFTPLEVLAAFLGKGAMLTVICEKNSPSIPKRKT